MNSNQTSGVMMYSQCRQQLMLLQLTKVMLLGRLQTKRIIDLRLHQPIPKVIIRPRVIHHLDSIWMVIRPWNFLPVDQHLEANQDLVTDRHSLETLILVLDLVLIPDLLLVVQALDLVLVVLTLDLVLVVQPLVDQLDLAHPAITRTSILVSVDSIFEDYSGILFVINYTQSSCNCNINCTTSI